MQSIKEKQEPVITQTSIDRQQEKDLTSFLRMRSSMEAMFDKNDTRPDSPEHLDESATRPGTAYLFSNKLQFKESDPYEPILKSYAKLSKS